MPNITLSVSEEVRRHMDEHPEVRWSNAIRAIIEKKLNDFDIAESLAQKSRLTEEDVALLSGKVNKAMGKRAKRLLDEGNS
ncbi:MAG: hypothetical protein J4415_04000 [Candidatus Diapherotrites archaeon]|uniref:Antitoxin n=1 Tax=Candidatus Iainarchaeum sp. TaxID=3101447 RepID=A0A8T4KTP1_9ARCH|nr:hypothetical protein [Candidatus Diapherotrites archaeon]